MEMSEIAKLEEERVSEAVGEIARFKYRIEGGRTSALTTLSVLPEFRKRGIQQGLIAKRLEFARDRGAEVATIGSIPGAATDRNVMRMGFHVAYTKTILRRPGIGLISSTL